LISKKRVGGFINDNAEYGCNGGEEEKRPMAAMTGAPWAEG
jgi:hypothetical protein